MHSYDSCFLSPGIEHLFVWMAATRFVQAAADALPNSVIYAPHTRVEQGFDLSVGHFDQEKRLRFMHKLLYGRDANSSWCDEKWVWTTREKRARRQLLQLVSAYERRQSLDPYLVIHVCYCLHEYRRMGAIIDGVRIYPFEDCHRTVVVCLKDVARPGWQEHISDGSHYVEVSHEPGSTPVATLVTPGKPFPLTVIPFDELVSRFRKWFTGEQAKER